jgi:hypothetical protein
MSSETDSSALARSPSVGSAWRCGNLYMAVILETVWCNLRGRVPEAVNLAGSVHWSIYFPTSRQIQWIVADSKCYFARWFQDWLPSEVRKAIEQILIFVNRKRHSKIKRMEWKPWDKIRFCPWAQKKTVKSSSGAAVPTRRPGLQINQWIQSRLLICTKFQAEKCACYRVKQLKFSLFQYRDKHFKQETSSEFRWKKERTPDEVRHKH